MTAHAAVGIHDDLASGQPGIAHGTANHEPAGGIDVVLGVLVEQFSGNHRLDDVLQNIGAQLLVADILKHVIQTVIPAELLDEDTKYHINPTGRFVIGGTMGDSGLTGRKIIVDTYGGMGRHGDDAFSGKDPTKVDRSAAYMARYIAKNIVASGLADRCEVQLAYAIGVADPISVLVDTFGTEKIDANLIPDLVRANFKLKPREIIETLNLRRPIYRKTAAYGHFGRNDPDFTWEATDKAAKLATDAGLKREPAGARK